MMIKKICCIALLLCCSCYLFAQKKNAYGSEQGVYLLNTIPAANKKIPYKTGVSYKVERAIAGTTDYKKLFNYSSPGDLNDFQNRVADFQSHFAYSTDIESETIIEAWKKYSVIHHWDSLRKYIAYMPIAAGLGVLICDSTVQPNTAYIYKITCIDESGKDIESITTNEVRSPEKMTYKIPRYYKTTSDGISLTVMWYVINDRTPHHFKIYRAAGPLTKYEPINVSKNISVKKDTLIFSFTDTHISSGSMYRYYISPSNSYGNYNIHSDTILATNQLVKYIELPYNMQVKANDSLNANQITWQLNNAEKIGTVQLYRSTDYDKNYVQLVSLPGTITNYTDKGIAPGIRYYYYFTITDRLGNKSDIATAKIFAINSGSAIPNPPIKVFAKATDNNVVVYWLSGEQNINGFYVQRCEGIDGAFTQVSSFIPYTKDTVYSWQDNNSSLIAGNNYSYRVIQENTGHLSSHPSVAALVQPIKNKTAMTMPRVTMSATAVNEYVLLNWTAYNFEHIGAVNIFRKKENESSYQLLNKFPIDAGRTSFVDSTAEDGNAYQYRLDFVSEDGKPLNSAATAYIKMKESGIAIPYNLTGNNENQTIQLSWEYAGTAKHTFKVYRRTPGKNPELLGETKELKYSMPSSEKENTVLIYFVTAVSQSGQESLWSNDVKFVAE